MDYIALKAALSDAERKHGLLDLDQLTHELLRTIAQADLDKVAIRMSDLKAKYDCTFPTLIARVQRLVNEGWIERQDNAEDRRSAFLKPTAKARTAFREISDLLQQM